MKVWQVLVAILILLAYRWLRDWLACRKWAEEQERKQPTRLYPGAVTDIKHQVDSWVTKAKAAPHFNAWEARSHRSRSLLRNFYQG